MPARYQSALLTGGAGFIGLHLLGRLAPICATITVFDNMLPQVHGAAAADPVLPEGVRFIRGDVRDSVALGRAVKSTCPDLIVHLAAETGTGQSYEEISRYCNVNVMGTAHLAEAIRQLPPTAARRRVILPSSRAVYGEGAYLDGKGTLLVPPPRRAADLASGRFAPAGDDGTPLRPVATPESAPPAPGSIYASTKLAQEFILSQALDGTDTDLLCLRLQNVYGPGQSAGNPYTGVLTIFCGQIAAGKPLNIFEDGEITRDFVHVSDVATALVLAAQTAKPPAGPINVGSGRGTTILAAARRLLRLFDRPEELRISGDFRAGDIRHAVADTLKAERALGFRACIDIDSGLADLVSWIKASPSASRD